MGRYHVPDRKSEKEELLHISAKARTTRQLRAPGPSQSPRSQTKGKQKSVI
jgi:hypothetical protein